MAYKLKSAVFLCHLILLSAQLANCWGRFKEFKPVVPMAFYFMIFNLSYLLLESVYYLTIGIIGKISGAIRITTIVVQIISTGLMTWGIIVESGDTFSHFNKLNRNSKDTQDLIIIFTQMVHLRLIYIAILILLKILW